MGEGSVLVTKAGIVRKNRSPSDRHHCCVPAGRASGHSIFGSPQEYIAGGDVITTRAPTAASRNRPSGIYFALIKIIIHFKNYSYGRQQSPPKSTGFLTR